MEWQDRPVDGQNANGTNGDEETSASAAEPVAEVQKPGVVFVDSADGPRAVDRADPKDSWALIKHVSAFYRRNGG